MVTNFKELIVWQKAMDLVLEVYGLVKLLPKEEIYSLSDQMRRAAVSVPSNIAEGQARNHTKEFIQFISIAKGSLAELETQLLVCVRLEYIDDEQTKKALALIEKIGKMLSGLQRRLNE